MSFGLTNVGLRPIQIHNRRVSVWSKSEFAPKQIKMHSGGNSVMVWGCFSKHGTGNLVSLKGTMDGKQNIEVLTENLLEGFKNGQKNIPGKWRLMQDNLPFLKTCQSLSSSQ